MFLGFLSPLEFIVIAIVVGLIAGTVYALVAWIRKR